MLFKDNRVRRGCLQEGNFVCNGGQKGQKVLFEDDKLDVDVFRRGFLSVMEDKKGIVVVVVAVAAAAVAAAAAAAAVLAFPS